jgi:hypothetical protein
MDHGTLTTVNNVWFDKAFNTQGAALTATVATPALSVAGGSAVPEPASLGLLSIGEVGLLGRRRSRR